MAIDINDPLASLVDSELPVYHTFDPMIDLI